MLTLIDLVPLIKSNEQWDQRRKIHPKIQNAFQFPFQFHSDFISEAISIFGIAKHLRALHRPPSDGHPPASRLGHPIVIRHDYCIGRPLRSSVPSIPAASKQQRYHPKRLGKQHHERPLFTASHRKRRSLAKKRPLDPTRQRSSPMLGAALIVQRSCSKLFLSIIPVGTRNLPCPASTDDFSTIISPRVRSCGELAFFH